MLSSPASRVEEASSGGCAGPGGVRSKLGRRQQRARVAGGETRRKGCRPELRRERERESEGEREIFERERGGGVERLRGKERGEGEALVGLGPILGQIGQKFNKRRSLTFSVKN